MLGTCARCHRHIREPRCPFCRARGLAPVGILTLAVAATACQTRQPTMYGAPPVPQPQMDAEPSAPPADDGGATK